MRHIRAAQNGGRAGSSVQKAAGHCAQDSFGELSYPTVTKNYRTQTGEIEKVFALIEKQPQEYKDKMFNEYLVDEWAILSFQKSIIDFKNR